MVSIIPGNWGSADLGLGAAGKGYQQAQYSQIMQQLLDGGGDPNQQMSQVLGSNLPQEQKQTALGVLNSRIEQTKQKAALQRDLSEKASERQVKSLGKHLDYLKEAMKNELDPDKQEELRSQGLQVLKRLDKISGTNLYQDSTQQEQQDETFQEEAPPLKGQDKIDGLLQNLGQGKVSLAQTAQALKSDGMEDEDIHALLFPNKKFPEGSRTPAQQRSKKKKDLMSGKINEGEYREYLKSLGYDQYGIDSVTKAVLDEKREKLKDSIKKMHMDGGISTEEMRRTMKEEKFTDAEIAEVEKEKRTALTEEEEDDLRHESLVQAGYDPDLAERIFEKKKKAVIKGRK